MAEERRDQDDSVLVGVAPGFRMRTMNGRMGRVRKLVVKGVRWEWNRLERRGSKMDP